MGHQTTLAQRFNSHQYDRQDVLHALRGENLSEHLGYPLIKLCITSGILHRPSFAEGEAAVLRRLPGHPVFTRAINARAIMSNRVPDMDPAAHPEELPYCIWYPDVAHQDTYRQLVRRYPQMRYQAARACALQDLLPEVSIAEEARDAGSDAILTHIMSQPVRYKVMDDYFRTVKPEAAHPASVNNDTFVLSMLKRQKQEFTDPSDSDDFSVMPWDCPGFKNMMFNITEDQGIAESVPEATSASHASTDDLMLHLLSSPLPHDLPVGNKDLLILTAAFYGDIDRYVRLRRPKTLQGEDFCVSRGIYHNSLFALWWSRIENPPENEPFHMQIWDHIKKAIAARRIMNNDLFQILLSSESAGSAYEKRIPYLIWYPEVAAADTYRALAHRVPEMREACIRAAIYAGYSDLFDELLLLPGAVPSRYLVAEAKRTKNPQRFVSALQLRADELGIDVDSYTENWKLVSVRDTNFLRRSNYLPKSPSKWSVFGQFFEQGAVYNGIMAVAEELELFLMAPESWRPDGGSNVELDYKNWPRV
ncbi:hypothetical protein F4778DRAFT_799173 [Xylariomycetidae sp. FL2044]|nr:hypothetical protein F4778DRAFT_799173 [Xylariomycetidae sp. FL2044]